MSKKLADITADEAKSDQPDQRREVTTDGEAQKHEGDDLEAMLNRHHDRMRADELTAFRTSRRDEGTHQHAGSRF
ncbi:MAG: hypothetical protein ABJC05_12340 [Pyrinomonadaceae bacterium]